MNAQNTTGVYTGIWTNWSRGRIAGSTLTLSAAHGALLIAFLAFFVTVVASALWKTFTYILFHIFSTKAPDARDGLYHQRQAILKNSPNPLSGLFCLVRSGWAWRRSAKGTNRRMLPVILFTAICVALFSLASGFSSKVATSLSSEALISSPVCLAVPHQVADVSACLASESSLIDAVQQAEFGHDLAIYAKECYSDTPMDAMTSCGKLVKPSLTIQSDTNAACPFNNTLCRTNTSNIFLDTGLLDSQDDLGLNAPPGQRFKYRTTAHCAPLNTHGRSGYTNMTNHGDRSKVVEYFFGGIDNHTEYTFLAPSHWHTPLTASTTPRYLLGTSQWWPSFDDKCHPAWVPIDDLRLPNAMLEIIWLTADSIIYGGQVLDPWFNASTKKQQLNDDLTVYFRDEPAAPMACVQREQYCNPNLPELNQCTPLMDQFGIKQHALKLWEGDPAFQDALFWIMLLIYRSASTFGEITSVLGDASLLAARSVNRLGFQKALSDDQWHSEVRFWFSIKLAGLQRMFLSLTRTPDPSSVSIHEELPANVSELLCGNQKILSSDHTSFNFACLVSILLAGALIIAIACNLDRLYNLYARFRHHKDGGASSSLTGTAYAQLEWWASDTLQLQRLAHELVGSGTWSGRLDSAPVTCGRDEKLATLDFDEERRRPLLKPLCEKGGASDADTPSQNAGSNDALLEGGAVGAGKAAHSRAMSV